VLRIGNISTASGVESADRGWAERKTPQTVEKVVLMSSNIQLDPEREVGAAWESSGAPERGG
jgi:hypothetical protein